MITPWWIVWNLVGFAGAFLVNSVIEWASHRWILHSNRIVRFAWLLHDQEHHPLFPLDDYTATTDSPHDTMRRTHVAFVPRDYLGFMAATAPIWLGAEWLAGVPIALGAALATLAQLQLFNSLHWRFHVPAGSWFERTWFFRFLAQHHRLHHARPMTNLNVSFLPLADFCFGTLRRE